MSKSLDKIIRAFAYIAGVLIVVLALLIVYEATNRYLFDASSVTISEIQWHIFDIIFLLGLSYTMQQDKHVRVDIFYDSFSPKTKAIVNIISIIFLIIPFTLIVIYTSYTLVEMSYLQHEISSDPGGLGYRFLIKGMIIVGFVLLLLQSISDLGKHISTLRNRKW
jgi:TRAP-type mannitol/chloroaromatic compound transport system permease small subunit